MAAKTSQSHLLTDDDLHDSATTTDSTHAGISAENIAVTPRGETDQYAETSTKSGPETVTPRKSRGGAYYVRKKRLAAGLPLRPRGKQPGSGEKRTLDWLRARSDIDPATGCWNWRLSVDRQNYGRVHGNTGPGKRAERAHRLAWMLAAGMDVPPGKVVCHTCDNARCCNPAHLVAETQQWNMRDCRRKGRR